MSDPCDICSKPATCKLCDACLSDATIGDIVKWLRKRHGEHLRMQSIIGGSAFGDGRRDECGIIANLLESGDWRKEIEQ